MQFEWKGEKQYVQGPADREELKGQRLRKTEAIFWGISWRLNWTNNVCPSRTNRLEGCGSKQRSLDLIMGP